MTHSSQDTYGLVRSLWGALHLEFSYIEQNQISFLFLHKRLFHLLVIWHIHASSLFVACPCHSFLRTALITPVHREEAWVSRNFCDLLKVSQLVSDGGGVLAPCQLPNLCPLKCAGIDQALYAFGLRKSVKTVTFKPLLGWKIWKSKSHILPCPLRVDRPVVAIASWSEVIITKFHHHTSSYTGGGPSSTHNAPIAIALNIIAFIFPLSFFFFCWITK